MKMTNFETFLDRLFPVVMKASAIDWVPRLDGRGGSNTTAPLPRPPRVPRPSPRALVDPRAPRAPRAPRPVAPRELVDALVALNIVHLDSYLSTFKSNLYDLNLIEI